jgi:hypothetical protein
MPIEVKRFKAEDGREGSYAPIGDGLLKLLFDDGSMVILREPSTETAGADESVDNPDETPRHA